MDNKRTIFQKLNDFFKTKSTQSSINFDRPLENERGLFSNNSDDIILKTTNKAEYENVKNTLHQSQLFLNQYLNAERDVDTKNLLKLSHIQLMYRECDRLEEILPEIASALDIYSEEATYIPRSGSMLNIRANDARIENELKDLFYNRLSINVNLPVITRDMVKYGNDFLLLNIDNENGVLGWKKLPVMEIERNENNHTLTNTSFDLDKQNTTYTWTNSGSTIPYQDFQVAHFRLLNTGKFLPYGSSIFTSALFRYARLLQINEDMLMLTNLHTIPRFIYNVNISAIDEADIEGYLYKYTQTIRNRQIVNPIDGQIDIKKNVLSVTDSFIVPNRGDGTESTKIDVLSPSSEGAEKILKNIDLIQKKIFTAIRIPKLFLNYGDENSTNEGKNLSLLDIRFARMVHKIQQALLLELNKIATIHLFLRGFKDELNSFNLSLNIANSQMELQELELLQKKVSLARDLMNDPGVGLPIYSHKKTLTEIFNLSDNDYKQNLLDIRSQFVVTYELKNTHYKVRSSGLFDNVDSLILSNIKSDSPKDKIKFNYPLPEGITDEDIDKMMNTPEINNNELENSAISPSEDSLPSSSPSDSALDFGGNDEPSMPNDINDSIIINKNLITEQNFDKSFENTRTMLYKDYLNSNINDKFFINEDYTKFINQLKKFSTKEKDKE